MDEMIHAQTLNPTGFDLVVMLTTLILAVNDTQVGTKMILQTPHLENRNEETVLE